MVLGGVEDRDELTPFGKSLILMSEHRGMMGLVVTFCLGHSLFPNDPGLEAIIACGQGGSCPARSVCLVLSSSGQFLHKQLCPLYGSDGLPQTVSTLCGERDRQVCLLQSRTVLRLLGCLQVSETYAVPRWLTCLMSSGWGTLSGPQQSPACEGVSRRPNPLAVTQ